MTQPDLFRREALAHLDALRHFAFQLSKNKHNTDDLVQETMLKACRYFHTYKEGTNCRAWLFQICKNSYINSYRRKQYEPVLVDFSEGFSHSQLEGDTCGMHAPPIDSETAKGNLSLLSDEVVSALGTLPIDYQTAVILSDIEGYTYEEIAAFTHVPIGTVRSRIHRGRKSLSDRLARYALEIGSLCKN